MADIHLSQKVKMKMADIDLLKKNRNSSENIRYTSVKKSSLKVKMVDIHLSRKGQWKRPTSIYPPKKVSKNGRHTSVSPPKSVRVLGWRGTLSKNATVIFFLGI